MINAEDVEIYDTHGTRIMWGDLIPLKEWLDCVSNRLFIDYDGMGHAVQKQEKFYRILSQQYVYPSSPANIPAEATHILWFNR